METKERSKQKNVLKSVFLMRYIEITPNKITNAPKISNLATSYAYCWRVPVQVIPQAAKSRVSKERLRSKKKE